jgi:hypothetical protein
MTDERGKRMRGARDDIGESLMLRRMRDEKEDVH